MCTAHIYVSAYLHTIAFKVLPRREGSTILQPENLWTCEVERAGQEKRFLLYSVFL